MLIRQSRLFLTILVASTLWIATQNRAAWAQSSSVFIEDLTWTEARGDLHAGKTTIIIPIGGTEQSGPHIALGKHNVRARILAGKIAASLGNALVAPVIAYVPEGSINPPAGHMRFTGTISVPDDAFKSMLVSTARSFKQHGFIDIVLIGDHGGYQAQLKAVAKQLNREWAGTRTRAHFIGDYYTAADADFAKALRAKGFTDKQIGTHAGLADTSLMMAVDAELVRPKDIPRAAHEGKAAGVAGDPSASSAALGQLGVDLIVAKTVSAIRAAQGRQH